MKPDILRERIRDLLREQNLKPIPIAVELGKGRDFLSDFLGERKDKLAPDFLVALAHRLDCDVDYFLDEKAPPAATGRLQVSEPAEAFRHEYEAPITGRVGAGARVEALVDADPETVTVPHWLQGALAFRVVGDSCVPVFEHGDLVLVHSEGTGGPGDFLNRFCIVETDGLGYLKRIRPGTAGRYDLESPNADTLYGREISRPRPVVMRIIQGGR